MNGLLGIARLALQRNWRERSRFLALGFGFLLSGILLSGTAVFSDTMQTTALTYALAQLPEEEVHLRIRAPSQRRSFDVYQQLDESVISLINKEVGEIVDELPSKVTSSTFYLARGDNMPSEADSRPRGFFLSLGQIQEHLDIVDGAFPTPIKFNEDSRANEFVVPGLIGEDSAQKFNLAVGDILGLFPYWDDRFEKVVVTIVGIGKRQNPHDSYWIDRPDPLVYADSTYKTLPILIPHSTLFEGVGHYFQNLQIQPSWQATINEDHLTPVNAEIIALSLHRLRLSLLQLPSEPQLATELTSTLESYTSRLFFTGVPLTLLVTQVEGIIVIYLFMLGLFLIERQRAELTLLRSRGASTLQLLLPFIVDGLFLAGLTVALTPPLAIVIISLLGLTPGLEPLSGGALLQITFTAKAFLLAAVASGMGLLSIMVPAFIASRETGVKMRQRTGRRSQPPFFLRYHLDVLGLALVVIIGWQMSQQGSLIRFTLAGEAVVNPVLYVLPSLLVLAGAMLFLRIFPLVTTMISKLIEPRAPVWILLGMWYLSRGSGTSGALVLLLAMATGTTLFAASFGPTLERNAQQNIYYETGAPLRLENVGVDRTGASFNLVSKIEDIPEILAVSPAYRGSGTDLSSMVGNVYTMLAIDPDTFPQVAWHRSDFSKNNLHQLTSTLAQDTAPHGGMPIPPSADHLGIWVRSGISQPRVNLYAKVQDANGRTVDYTLGRLDFTGWKYLEAPLESTEVMRYQPPFHPKPPLLLQALFVRASRGRDTGPGIIYMDNLQVTSSASNDPIILEPFEAPGGWWVIQDGLERVPDSLDYVNNPVHDGSSSGAFAWVSASIFSVQGISPIYHANPLSAIASGSFLSHTGRSVGDHLLVSVSGQTIPVEIVDQVEFFSTLNPYDEDFLIVNLDRLQERGNLLSPATEFLPNEIWLDTEDAATAMVRLEQAFRELPVRLRKPLDRSELLTNAQVDPFVMGGWTGWLLLAFVTTPLVSAAGFVTYAISGLERRQGSIAALGSLGMSSRQVMGTVALEFLFLLVAGGLLGAFMGVWLGSLLLPFLDITGSGQAAVPPLVVERTWGAVSLVYLGIAGIFGFLLIFVLRWFSNLALQRVLKLEEV